MAKLFSYLVMAFILSAQLLAQSQPLEKQIDKILSANFNRSDPGCVLLIAKGVKPVYRKAFGLANLELNVSLQPEMAFNIASITKQFTAVAILKLMEDGKLSLQDSLQKFIPDYPWKGNTITIEHLLTHTSGVQDYMQIDYRNPNMERWDFSPKQLIDSFKNYPLNFEPGSKFSYSNSGYYMLGYIIERITGLRYQNYIEENLLKPLRLSHTYFDSTGIIIPNRVSGYRREGDVLRREEYWSPTIEYAAGGLISNVDDLLAWHKGIFSYQILKRETLQKAFQSYKLKDGSSAGYGYGWFLRKAGDIASIEHAGGIPGFVSNEIYFPKEDIFIAILCNSGTAPIEKLSVEISGVALGKALQPSVNVDERTIDQYLGVYRLSIDKSRTMTIMKEKAQLVAKVSASDKIPLIFQSQTKFQFKDLLDAQCEFIIENGKVVRFDVSQNGHYEWIKE